MSAKGALVSVMCIALVAMLAGAGTLAYFSDTETSTGNTFTAGTFDIEWSSGSTLPLQAYNIKPGWSASTTQGIKNTGSVGGKAWFTAEDFAEPTNYWAEPSEPEPSIEVGPKDFADILYMRVWADLDDDHEFEESELIYDGSLRDMNTAKFYIGPGDFVMCKFEAYLPTDLNDEDNIYEDTPGGIPAIDGNEDDNAYQADGVKCNITVHGATFV